MDNKDEKKVPQSNHLQIDPEAVKLMSSLHSPNTAERLKKLEDARKAAQQPQAPEVGLSMPILEVGTTKKKETGAVAKTKHEEKRGGTKKKHKASTQDVATMKYKKTCDVATMTDFEDIQM